MPSLKELYVIIMATIITTLKRVSVYEKNDGIRYRFIFSNEFPAYRVNDNGEITLATADYVDFAPSVAIAQLVNCIPQLAAIHTDAAEKAIRRGVRGGLTAAQLQLICTDAVIELERTQFAANDPYKDADGNDAVHEHAGFSTNIKSVKLTNKMLNLIEEIQTKLLLNSLI